MIIKVINGFYDYDKNRIIEKDEVLDFDDEKAEELIALGLVVEVKKPEKKPEKEAEETPGEDPGNEAEGTPEEKQ